MKMLETFILPAFSLKFLKDLEGDMAYSGLDSCLDSFFYIGKG